MKTLVLLGGPMGVGKTATAQQLQKLLAPCVWLEGDWCWRMEPFDPSPANRELVLENIGFLLRNFLQSPSWGTVLFSWVLHEQGIFDRLRRELAGLEYAWRPFSLVCSPQALRQRLEGDIRAGRRTPDVVARSLERLPCYQKLPVPQVDTTHLTPAQAAREVFRLLWGPGGTGEPGPAEKAPGPGGLFAAAGGGICRANPPGRAPTPPPPLWEGRCQSDHQNDGGDHMDLLLIGYKNCSTSQKARRWLEAEGLPFTWREITTQTPTLQELADWTARAGLPLKKWFNTSGRAYQALGLKDKLPAMDPDQQLALLASDGMLLKRPLLVWGEGVLVGFSPEAWAGRLKGGERHD